MIASEHSRARRAAPRAARLLCALFVVASLGGCAGEINGRVDRIGGPIPGGGTPPTAAHPAFASVSAGGGHTCALTGDGAAWCWGDNVHGQLGRGSRVDATVPTKVTTDERFVSIQARGNRTCALTAAGAAWCWGENANGILHTGGATDGVEQPERVLGDAVWASIAIGVNHMCGIDTSGIALCWGNNSGGEAGIGEYTATVSAPDTVVGGLTWTHITAGSSYTCGRATDGRTFCWGISGVGDRLGSPGPSTHTPRATNTTTLFATVQGAYEHMCGIEADVARVSCWGDAAAVGSAGTGAGTVPTRVVFDRNVVDLGVGFSTSCLVTAGNNMWCWGLNAYGQLGNGSTTASTVPVAVRSSSAFRQVDVGTHHACAIATDGHTYCWGRNFSGELGNGRANASPAPTTTPVRVL